MNIYVGNLPFETTDDDLRKMFEEFGQVESAKVIRDRNSDRSRGFGFVEMTDASKAQDAISALNNKDVMGRTLNVNEARPRKDR